MVQDLENEIWVPVIGFEGYELSNFQRVKALKKVFYAGYKDNQRNEMEEHLMAVGESLGYKYVQLRKDKKTYMCRIHRLMAIHFIPNPENKKTVNHINGDRGDNRVENLEWATQSENCSHAYRIGLRTGGVKGGDNCRARKIKCPTLDLSFSCVKEAADTLGMSPTGIILVCRGKQRHSHGLIFNYI